MLTVLRNRTCSDFAICEDTSQADKAFKLSDEEKIVTNEAKALGERIGRAIDMAGGNTVITAKLGISDSQLRRYTKGISEPSAVKLGQIAQFCGVSLSWLVYGTGSTISDGPEVTTPTTSDDTTLIPIVNVVAGAGNGYTAGPREVDGVLPFSTSALRRMGVDPKSVEFIRLSGDSMEPTIHDGSPVLVDRSKKEVRGDAIYVVSLGDEVRIKRVQKGIDGTVTLISDNNAMYAPERLSSVDAEQLKIHGRVFWTEKLL